MRQKHPDDNNNLLIQGSVIVQPPSQMWFTADKTCWIKGKAT